MRRRSVWPTGVSLIAIGILTHAVPVPPVGEASPTGGLPLSPRITTSAGTATRPMRIARRKICMAHEGKQGALGGLGPSGDALWGRMVDEYEFDPREREVLGVSPGRRPGAARGSTTRASP